MQAPRLREQTRRPPRPRPETANAPPRGDRPARGRERDPFDHPRNIPMIILHAGADNGRLWLSAEVPAEAPSPRAGRKPKDEDPSPSPYPYDAGPLRLAGAFVEALPDKPVPGGGEKPPTLWLPTTKGRPIPSSGLIDDVHPTDPLTLSPFVVTALPIPMPLAVELLCACDGRDTIAQGV